MPQPANFSQKHGTLAQMARGNLTTYAINTQQWIKASLQRAGVSAPDCKLRKT